MYVGAVPIVCQPIVTDSTLVGAFMLKDGLNRLLKTARQIHLESTVGSATRLNLDDVACTVEMCLATGPTAYVLGESAAVLSIASMSNAIGDDLRKIAIIYEM